MKKTILATLWTLFWAWIVFYCWMPVLSFSFSGVYIAIIVYVAVLGVIFIRFNDYTQVGSSSKTMFGTGTACLLVFAIMGIRSCGCGHSDEYRALLGPVEKTNFTADIAPVNPNEMIVVDEDVAKRIGEKDLGEVTALGSKTEVGDFTLQKVNNHLYWVAPLEHSGFWKYWNFGDEGTPGYIMVSATNQEDHKLVQADKNGNPIVLKYLPSAYFKKDLDRLIYMGGYASVGTTNYSFEIDDNGKPFWVVTTYEHKVGLSGSDATGILIIDPTTGHIEPVSLEKAPDWVDRIQPDDFIYDQVKDWGDYIHGWYNPSDKDKIVPSDDYSIVFGADKRTYLYFGMESTGKEGSTVGFLLVDTKTKKAKMFHQAGATEKAARGSAEGKVQQMGYTGSDGITYNIDGIPTYEFLLKDKSGLVKMIALVSVKDHTIVGVGENRLAAYQDYKTALRSFGNVISTSTSDLKVEKITGIIQRIVSETNSGKTIYYVLLSSPSNKVFMGSTALSLEIPLSKEGDIVYLEYTSKEGEEIDMSKYDNLMLDLVKTEGQILQTKTIDSLRNKTLQKGQDKIFNKTWDKLSPEEKEKALEGIKK